MPKVILGSCEVSRYPEFAGSTWVWLQYMLGLERMGVECFWVDHLGAVDPLKDAHSLQYMLDRFAQTAREFAQEYLDSSKVLPKMLEACAAR